jgi:SprT protein
MPKREAPLHTLRDYLPDGSYEAVLHYLKDFKVHLTITRERKTVLGDYRHAFAGKNHRISVNGNLNRYSFLITLIHELAHLVTFNEFGNAVSAHGKEWKRLYAQLMSQFLKARLFPEDIQHALERSLHNLPASSCADEKLMRVLNRYDEGRQDHLMVEQLPEGAVFSTSDERLFKKGPRLRKRFQCIELKTGKLYLFSPVYEVKPVNK